MSLERLPQNSAGAPYSYGLYGKVLASDWRISGLEESSGSPAHIRLRAGEPELFAEFAARSHRPFGPRNWFERTVHPDGVEHLVWPRLFEFLVSPDGRDVQGIPLSEGAAAAFEVYLLGQVISFAFIKQGIEPIHGTAVVIDGKAVAFIGDCTYGKSTLACAFLRHGHALLTDDQLVTSNSDGLVFAQPGPPRIKLLPESARALIGDEVECAPMNAFTTKVVVPLSDARSCRKAVHLSAIYALNDPGNAHHKIEIRPLSPRTACIELLRATFNPVVEEPARIQRQFSLYSELASRVPVRSLSYPREFSRLLEIVKAVENDLRTL